MRFGDGDVYLSLGKNDSYQAHNIRLRAESIHSALYGCEKEMFPGNHLLSDKAATDLLMHVFHFFVGYQIFSHVALHYAASYRPVRANNFLKMVKQQAILFIGNENTPQEVVIKLFGRVTHVKTPAKNAYDKIDTIEKQTTDILDRQEEFGVVVVAMGCSGRVLMKRLHKKTYPVFFFDFGSLLDGICGNQTRTWLSASAINYESLLNDL